MGREEARENDDYEYLIDKMYKKSDKAHKAAYSYYSMVL